ncbi:MAG: LytTR family DNA-binding domain-containing protein [Pseudomonadota bacterium]
MSTSISQPLSIPARARGIVHLKREWAAFILLHLSFGIGYVIVFQLTRIETFSDSIAGALINVIPLVVVNFAAIKFLEKSVLGRASWRHAFVHPILGAAYSFSWYFCVMVGRGVKANWLEQGFSIRPFGWVGGTWQLYQGLALYGIAAVFAYALYFYRRAVIAESALSKAEIPDRNEPVKTNSLVVKSHGEFVAFDWSDIVFIEASGDEVIIHTENSRTKTHKTMTSIARKMPSPPLARIHRSLIANIDKVLSAEPAGNGKLTLHMSDGISLTTSRAGAQTFKACVD